MQAADNTAHQGHKAARLNRMVQLALISGISLSMLFMVVGALLFFFHNTTGGATSVGLRSVLPGIVTGNPLTYMVLGLIVLMITPALRVLVAALGYVLDREWRFALISLGVVAVLAVSVMIGAS